MLTPQTGSDVIAGLGVSPERIVAAALLLEVDGSPSDLGAFRRSAGTLTPGTPERAVVDGAWAAVAARLSPGDAGVLCHRHLPSPTNRPRKRPLLRRHRDRRRPRG